ncbi:ribonuclease H-like domain-containing protein, partial [Tanacetum coccineum]
IFKHKFHADGTLSRYKARLVANGSSQQLELILMRHLVQSLNRPPFAWSLALMSLGSQVAYLLIYANDIILIASCPALLQQIIGLFLSQKKYALQLFKHAYMVTCNPSRTPVDIESKLGPEGVPVQDPTLYRSFAKGSRAALCCSQTYLAICSGDCCPSTHSAEAEYRGVANVVAKTAWVRNLLRELHSPLMIATLVCCDNVSAVYMSANLVQHQRTKHIEIDIHFVRDIVTVGHVCVLHVPSRFQYADIFTKGLPSKLFEDF